MKLRLLLLAIAMMGASVARSQTQGLGEAPIEISVGEGGETHAEGGLFFAQNNVVIHYGTAAIYADYAQYNPDTHDVLLVGNVRIYREGQLFTGDRALYNLETKLLRASEFKGEAYPLLFQAQAISSLEGGGFQGTGALLTTSDSSKPDYTFRARSVTVYPGDHAVLSNATLYVGTTPVFWFPYYYQSLKRNQGFHFIPGYNDPWGAYLLIRDAFPITDTIHGVAHLDIRSKRGAATGVDAIGTYGPGNESWMRFRSYYAYDADPNLNTTALPRLPVPNDRYRFSLQDRTFFTDSIYASADINKLSDYLLNRDFFPAEYRNNPQPDNMVNLTKWDENYTLTGIVRGQFNNFFATTERLPEVVLDVKRQALFDSPVFYEGQTGVARLGRKFGIIEDGTSSLPSTLTPTPPDYNTTRIDSFHQLLMPTTVGGWLSLVPRIGIRGTYYENRADSTLQSGSNFSLLGLSQNAQVLFQKAEPNSLFRPVFNAGVESSFKLSREWERVQTRDWGLDGLRHVFQPYTNFSYVHTTTNPLDVLQFDRLSPSTQLPSLNFPQYNSIDALPNWTIARLGVRNRLQTRRNDMTVDWLSMDTFFNYNLNAPQYPGIAPENTFSNVFNRLVWSPLPWASLVVDSQLPLLNSGFTQIDTGVGLKVTQDFGLNVGHRYLSNNPFFENGNNLRVAAYYRIDDNWSLDVSEQYEFERQPGTYPVGPGLEIQQYEIHRALSSWVVSLGFTVRRNSNSLTGASVTDSGVILTFTLKDLPSLNLPVAFDPSSSLQNR